MIPLQSFGCVDLSLPAFGECRLGFPVPILDSAQLEVAPLIQSLSRPGSPFFLMSNTVLDASMLVLGCALPESSMLARSFACLGFVPPASDSLQLEIFLPLKSHVRLGVSLSAPSFTHPGSLLSLHSFS